MFIAGGSNNHGLVILFSSCTADKGICICDFNLLSLQNVNKKFFFTLDQKILSLLIVNKKIKITCILKQHKAYFENISEKMLKPSLEI